MRLTFSIQNNEKNINWCANNLMPIDYEISGKSILIYYNHHFQKSDILNAINSPVP